jgi:hypothetical protein
MRSIRLLLFALACLAWAPVPAAALSFIAYMDGPSESPANGSPGTAIAIVDIDSVAHTMQVDINFSGLTSNNTAAHIHVINGPGDTNTADTLGPVATITPTFTGFPSGTTAGSYSHLFDTTDAGTYRAGFISDAGGTTAQAEAALFAGITEGRAYVNIHTVNFGGGEIRGFLQAVPEPTTGALLGLGVAVLAARRRRLTYAT